MITAKRNRYQAKHGKAEGRVVIDAMLAKLKEAYNPKDNRLDLCDPIIEGFAQMLSDVADSLRLDKMIVIRKGIFHTEVTAISSRSKAVMLVYNWAIEDCEFMQAYLTLRLRKLLHGDGRDKG